MMTTLQQGKPVFFRWTKDYPALTTIFLLLLFFLYPLTQYYIWSQNETQLGKEALIRGQRAFDQGEFEFARQNLEEAQRHFRWQMINSTDKQVISYYLAQANHLLFRYTGEDTLYFLPAYRHYLELITNPPSSEAFTSDEAFLLGLSGFTILQEDSQEFMSDFAREDLQELVQLAEEEITRLSEVSPKDDSALRDEAALFYLTLGDLYARVNLSDKANEAYEKGLRLNSTYQIQLEKAQRLSSLPRSTTVMHPDFPFTFISKCMNQLGTDPFIAHLCIAQLYYLLNQFQAAEALLLQTAEQFKGLAEVDQILLEELSGQNAYEWGQYLLSTNQAEAALAQFQSASRYVPDNSTYAEAANRSLSPLTVIGQVVSAEGKPISGATLSILGENNGKTGRDGQFNLKVTYLLPGQLTVVATSPDSKLLSSHNIDLMANQTEYSIQITLSKKPLDIYPDAVIIERLTPSDPITYRILDDDFKHIFPFIGQQGDSITLEILDSRLFYRIELWDGNNTLLKREFLFAGDELKHSIQNSGIYYVVIINTDPNMNLHDYTLLQVDSSTDLTLEEIASYFFSIGLDHEGGINQNMGAASWAYDQAYNLVPTNSHYKQASNTPEKIANIAIKVIDEQNNPVSDASIFLNEWPVGQTDMTGQLYLTRTFKTIDRLSLSTSIVLTGTIYQGTGSLEIDAQKQDYTVTIQLIPEPLLPESDVSFQTIASLESDASFLYNEALKRAREGFKEQSASLLRGAVALIIQTEDGVTNNEICWFGSIERFASIVMPACERAVALAPDNGAYIDSRGLARALTGDYKGAVADFEEFIEWSYISGLGRNVDWRVSWIVDLENGTDPFDEDTLNALRNE